MNENCPPNRSLKKKFKINKGIRCLKSWFDTNAWRFLISLSKISSWRGDVSRSSDADCVVGEVDISDVIASTVCVMELERCRGEVSTASNPSSLFACGAWTGWECFANTSFFGSETKKKANTYSEGPKSGLVWISDNCVEFGFYVPRMSKIWNV